MKRKPAPTGKKPGKPRSSAAQEERRIKIEPFLDEELEKLAGDLNLEERREFAEKLHRWSKQIIRSVEAETPGPDSWN